MKPGFDYSEQKGLIPFYYEFTEGKRSGKKFYHDFLTRFYMQVVGYYLRDILLIRNAVNFKADVDATDFRKKVEFIVPKMDEQESIHMTMNYGKIYSHSITPETASYIVHITNNVPGRIIDRKSQATGKRTFSTQKTAPCLFQ